MRARLVTVLVLPAFLVFASVGISAAAQGPAQWSPDPVAFGSAQVGSSPTRTVTVTNSGDTDMTIGASGVTVDQSSPDAGAFQVSNDLCAGRVLNPAGGPNPSCTADVTFSPTAAQGYAAQLDVASDSPTSPDPVAVTGTGTPAPAPAISVSPSSPFDFNNQKVGTSASQVFTVTNTGNASLDVTTVGAGPSDFSTSADGCAGSTLAQGDHCQVTVDYRPSAAGPITGQLSISSQQLAPYVVQLNGNGTVPVAVPNGPVTFATPVGVAEVLSVTLTNQGDAPLVVTGVSLTPGTDAAFTRLVGQGTCGGAVVAGGDSCSARVQFLPTSNGTYTGALQFTDDSNSIPGSTQQVQLSGTVLVPGIDANPSSLQFGQRTAGRISKPLPVTITNTGQLSLRVTELTVGGSNPANFVLGVETCTDAPIAPNDSCTANVRFAPRGGGQRVAALMVSSNAGTLNISLTGRGVPPPPVTGARAASGCSDAALSWGNPDAAGFRHVVLVRNSKRYPRRPSDGAVVRHQTGGTVDTAPRQFHVYYYALFAVYASFDHSRAITSPAVDLRVHTGRICRPRDGGLVRDLTPLVDWTAYPRARSYAFILQKGGHTISVRYRRHSNYQFPKRWRYAGGYHALARRSTYVLYLYAYTARRPGGKLIGHTTFSER
jgi:hypothetical protein